LSDGDSDGVSLFLPQLTKEIQFMKHLRQIGIPLLALGVMTSFAMAAHTEKAPDATMRLSFKSVSVGIGFSSGSGTLTYKGKDYPISVSGMSLGKVGVSGASATGKVYNLKSLADFDGHYVGAGTGMTVAGGRSRVEMKNQNGVQVYLAAASKGLDISLGRSGVEMSIKK
jgi:hypothetical protein